MKKSVFVVIAFVAAFGFLSGAAVQAQVMDFEDYNVGDVLDAIGWGGMVAEIADDPLAAGNNVLKFTPNNYNAAPVLEFTLPAGSTLADYPTFTFKAYFEQGDVGWKDIVVEAYQDMPTAQAYNNANVRIGSWNRATGASTTWEDISIDIAGSADLTGTIYIAFGINCAGEGNGVTTIWYADDVDLGIEGEEPSGEAYYIEDWGTLGGRWGNWMLEEGDVAGNVSMSGDGPPTGSWATVRGGFKEALDITTENAVIVRGSVEFVGDDLDTWGPIRYGFFHHDSSGTLQTDSTQATQVNGTTYYNKAWSGREDYAHGYMIAPRSGTNASISGWGTGGTGEVGSIDGSWISSWSGTGLLSVLPAPARAKITEGTYDFAMSVHALGDGTNEFRFYFEKQYTGDQTSYWFGGTAIDAAPVTDKINGFCFGKNNGNGAEETDITGFNLMEVEVDYGDPITVTDEPWEAYYIDAWGTIGGRWGNWMLEEGDFVGDVSMSGDGPPTGSWATVRGGFVKPLEITTDKAVIVRGSVEFVGDDLDTWGPIRYGFFHHDSSGTLQTDSTQATQVNGTTYYNKAWSGREDYAHGYMIAPRSGTNASISGWGTGGTGEVGSINGSWISSWSGTGLLSVLPAPARAKITEGTYDFAMSVHALGDGTNEFRFYFEKQYTGDQTSYWFGGTAIDAAPITDTINGFCFGKNNGNGAEETDITGFNLWEVEVDYGDPITVTDEPWEAYYIDAWGTIGGRWGNWRLEEGDFVGDVSMSGDGPPTGNWATVRGGFVKPLEITTEKAVIVRGSVEFVGDDLHTWGPIRYGFFHHDSSGTLQTDSTQATQVNGTTYYNKAWSGREDYAHGYMIAPRSGTIASISGWGSGGTGEVGSINGSWISSWSGTGLLSVLPAPARAMITEGTYDFAMSVHALADGSNEFRFYFEKQYTGEQTSYWYGGTAIDTAPITDTINGFCFGKNNGNGAEETDITGFNLWEVEVDYGDPITISEKPWEAYYVDVWGFSGGNLGGWDLTLGDFVGDVFLGGMTAPTDWSAVRGGFFEPYELSSVEDRSLIVTGTIELVGGGFEDVGSLRYGVFYSDMAGSTEQDADQDSNWVWNGTDGAHSGYLFVPPSGTEMPGWSGDAIGTWGAVANDTWWDVDASNNFPLGAHMTDPPGAVASAGEYDFAISVSPHSAGRIVRTMLEKTDGSYYFETSTNYPVVATTDKFNCVGFAINNSTTTAMNLIEIELDRGPDLPTPVEEDVKPLPTDYQLQQNYPNPFNPTTTIEFALPKQSDVKLVVYDASGRVVEELVNGNYQAGYHKVVFDASKLASGVYICKILAGEHVDVKKMLLMK